MTDPSTPGPQAADLFRRLRAWSVSAWRHGERIPAARATLAHLAVLATAHDGTPRPAVPDVGVHALVDQLQVLVADAVLAGAQSAQVCEVLYRLAGTLGLAGVRRNPEIVAPGGRGQATTIA